MSRYAGRHRDADPSDRSRDPEVSDRARNVASWATPRRPSARRRAVPALSGRPGPPGVVALSLLAVGAVDVMTTRAADGAIGLVAAPPATLPPQAALEAVALPGRHR